MHRSVLNICTTLFTMQVAGPTDARTRKPPQWSPILDCWHCMPKKGITCLNVKLQAVKRQLVDSGSSPTTSGTKPTPPSICNANSRSHLPKYGPTFVRLGEQRQKGIEDLMLVQLSRPTKESSINFRRSHFQNALHTSVSTQTKSRSP